jgi:hypothetical protein
MRAESRLRKSLHSALAPAALLGSARPDVSSTPRAAREGDCEARLRRWLSATRASAAETHRAGTKAIRRRRAEQASRPASTTPTAASPPLNLLRQLSMSDEATKAAAARGGVLMSYPRCSLFYVWTARKKSNNVRLIRYRRSSSNVRRSTPSTTVMTVVVVTCARAQAMISILASIDGWN